MVNRAFSRLFSVIVISALILLGCRSAPPVEPEEVEPQVIFDITGTWFLGNPRSMLIFQYRPDGTGSEITLNSASSFFLTYRPFTYYTADGSININFIDSRRPQRSVFAYEMPSARRLTIFDYTPGNSPTFIKQTSTAVEGLWRREGPDNIEYIFGGQNFMVRLQDGIPTATGNFILSDTSLIMNDLYRCIDYHSLRWTTARGPHETFLYRLSGDQLTLSSGNRVILLTR